MQERPQLDSLFNRQIRPVYQLGTAILLMIVVMGIAKVFKVADDPIFYWEIAFAVLMGFGLFNAIFSIPYKERMVYFRNSVFSYMALAILSGVLATVISGLSLDNAGEFRWLYIVFTFSYLVFISIVNAMRKIIEIAKRQDAKLRGEEPIDPRLN